jgi:hypothetical protein
MYEGKKKCNVILVYLENDIDSTEKKTDGNNMNLSSFAPVWYATSTLQRQREQNQQQK